MRAYYNEHDRFAAQWLRNLIAAGELPDGDVDERDIQDVRGDDVIGYVQCHFFSGVGGWPFALRLAGWPDDRPVWTGSCPCQPFSAAGSRKGEADERHLWPEFRRLIAECAPAIVFGEQVASKAGRQWLAGVRADLEGLGYAVGAADLCAASQGAPHIRQRLFWLADATRAEPSRWDGEPNGRSETHAERLRDAGGLEYADRRGREGSSLHLQPGQPRAAVSDVGGPGATVDGMEHAESNGRLERRAEPSRRSAEPRRESGWADSVLVLCRDGKARRIPTESELFPVAARVPGRVGALRAYGNAIVPQVAAEFVRAYIGAVT